MERLKAKKPKFRQLIRIGTMALAATIALSVPAVSNVISKVSPLNNSVVSAAEKQTNLMNSDEITTKINNNHDDDKEHWVHTLNNSGDMKIDGPEVDLTNLTYVVKFPDELSHLLKDDYVLDYLFGRITNFDSAQTPFSFTGHAIDENGEQITVSKDTHKPFEHIIINHNTNSIEFDFTSFYEANNLEPYVRQNVNGEYFFDTLGFTVPIIVPDDRMLDNGTYELKTAYVRGKSVDLDNVSNTYSVNLVVDYSSDPEPDPEPEKPEIDTTKLEALLTKAEDYAEEDYTEESFEMLVIAAEEALKVLENEDATQEEVDKAAVNLQDAIDGLVKVEDTEDPEIDKDELQALLSEAKDYDAEDYTDDSFDALTAAIAVAEEVLADEEATQDDVDETLAGLEAAIAGLVEIEEPTPEPEIDTSDLEKAIANAKGYNADDYTADSFAALTAALETAETVLSDEEATQDDVDEALADLEAAITGLVEIEEPTPKPEVDTSDLEKAIANANGYNAEDYTADSFAVLTAALETAKAVLANEEATQNDVDAALEDLENAIEGLKKDETETPKKKDDVGIIDNGLDNKVKEGEGNALPNTATSTFNMMLIGFLVLLAGCAGLYLRRKKFN